MYEKENRADHQNTVASAEAPTEASILLQAEAETDGGASGEDSGTNRENYEASGNEREANGESCEALETTLESDPDPDGVPAPDGTSVEADREDLADLRKEVSRLRALLSEQAERAERMRAECAELWELYPSLSPDTLPDEVWEAVEKGVPIAAAVALSERRKFLTAQKAEIAKLENRMRSTGAVEREKNGYFSPEEVRAMNRLEVRENYQSILKSMQKWK